MALKFKLETGIQLLTRLTKKPDIEHFFPMLFNDGPKHDEIIELYSSICVNPLLYELIANLIMPKGTGGNEASVLLFNTDGNFDLVRFKEVLRMKLETCINENKVNLNIKDQFDKFTYDLLKKIFLVNVYDASQFYITINNLESILTKHQNISLIVFNSLTAFYWSEQSFKVTKMDLYLKKILRLIQKVTKDFKTVILYTRPEYFSSSKETIENLEPCCSTPMEERINYRIQVSYGSNEESNEILIRTHDKIVKVPFLLVNSQMVW